MIEFCLDTILQTLRCLVYKGNELRICSFCSYPCYVCKCRITTGCHVDINIHGIITTRQSDVTSTINFTIEKQIARIVGIVHQQVVSVKVKMVSQVL